jgi:hypothetical protein
MKSIIAQTRPLVEKLADLYRNQLKNSKINATGKLSNFSTDIEFDGRTYTVYFLLEDYWEVVEKGRRAGATPPPIQPIENWVKVKLKVPSSRRVAFAISKSIGKRGIPGRLPLKKSIESPKAGTIIDEIKNTIISEINREIKDAVKPLLK